jgi:uncharacterized protein YdhG (YjbR/CyaY superfamily)
MATKRTTKGTTQGGASNGWTDDERAAMKERAAELKRSSGKGAAKAAEEAQTCLDKIAEMPEADRVIAERIHAIVTETAPDLTVRTWYGKFKARYATLGFSDVAALDDGNMWPSEFAVTKLTQADEKSVAALVRKAVG